MSISSYVLGKLCKLPPKSHQVDVDRDIKVLMRDGMELLTDHYYPRGEGTFPTILIRSPYGKGFFSRVTNVLPFVERGYHVVIQCCRGTFGSGGHLKPHHQEREDGLDTIAWLKKQDWFSGGLATFGPSYLGYVQWAIARSAGPELKAMAVQVTTSAFHKMFYMGGSLALNNHMGWTYLMKEAHHSRLGIFGGEKVVKRVARHLPLSEADRVGIGKTMDIWQDVVQNSEPPYEYWKPADHSGTLPEITIPINWIGGWFDIFLPWMIEDYVANRKGGQNPHLTIGPWWHMSRGIVAEGLRQGLAWFNAHLKGDHSGLSENPVRLFVMGSKKWKAFPEWPPPGYQATPWYLQPHGGLATETPAPSEPDRYRYDPSDPTPNLGGALFNPHAGQRDNRKLEARSDVLVYTSTSLDEDMEVIGPVHAKLYIKSSLAHTDFSVRLCDVEPSGKSLNVCDGLQRLRPNQPVPEKDGCIHVQIDLWPTAYCFRKGHSIRLQISSGAHPRWARNTGSGESIATATALRIADQEVYHDPSHPSAVILPVME